MEVENRKLKEGSDSEYETVKEITTLNSMIPIWKKNKKDITEEEYNRIREGCLLYDLPVSAEGLDEAAVLAVTKKDKKMEQGQIKFVLMKGIGNSFIDRSVSDEELLEGIREILK